MSALAGATQIGTAVEAVPSSSSASRTVGRPVGDLPVADLDHRRPHAAPRTAPATDQHIWAFPYQYMLGDHLLVAPATNRTSNRSTSTSCQAPREVRIAGA